MERDWSDTVHLLGLDIALLVVVVLMALSAITARLAMDPAEPAARWVRARIQALRAGAMTQSASGPGDGAAGSAAAASIPQTPAVGSVLETVTPEWLDRFLSREPQRSAQTPQPATTPRDAPSEADVA